MIRTFLLIIILGLSTKIMGQDWFADARLNEKVEGYIIGIAGDTISGFISYSYPVAMQKRVTFYRTLNDQPMIYKPEDIRGYGMNTRFWRSLKVSLETFDGMYTFNRFGILDKGGTPLGLFLIFAEKDKQKKRINSKEAEEMYKGIKFPREAGSYEYIYIKKFENPAESIATKEFRKSFADKMKPLIGDYKELMEKIESRKLQLEDIDQIVKEYNDWYLKKIRKQQG